MIFKNTFKLLLTNFSLTYKVFLYKLFALLLAFGVAGTIGVPFLTHLLSINFFGFVGDKFVNMFESFNISNIFVGMKDIFLKIIDVFASLDNATMVNAIVAISVFVLILVLIGSLDELAVIDVINANLTSKTKLSFFKSMVGKTFKSMLKSLIKFVVSLPYYVCLGLILYYGFTLFDVAGGILKVLIPMLMFLSITILSGIYLSLIAGFCPSIIVNDNGVFKSLKTGLKTVGKKYFRLLSSSVMLVFVILVCNLFLSVYSFFAGLIITVPVTIVVLDLFKTISYYECNGMRYYVGDEIRTPLRKEELDKMNKLKYVI
ncbi:MAG: hypothetical protein ACI4TI_02005 [Christensenellales bacterium]